MMHISYEIQLLKNTRFHNISVDVFSHFEFYSSCTMFVNTSSGRKRSSAVHNFLIKNGESFVCIVTFADQNPCRFKSKTSNGPSNLKEHLRKRHPLSFEEFKNAEREQTANEKAEEETRKVKRLGGENSSITDYVVTKLRIHGVLNHRRVNIISSIIDRDTSTN